MKNIMDKITYVSRFFQTIIQALYSDIGWTMSLEIGILILITDEDLLVKIVSDDLRPVVNLRIKTLDKIGDASQRKFVRLRKNDTDHDLSFIFTSWMIINLIYWYLYGVRFYDFWKIDFLNMFLIWKVVFRSVRKIFWSSTIFLKRIEYLKISEKSIS